MNWEILINLLKWCAVINISIILISSLIFSFTSKFSYKNNKILFGGNKEDFNKTIYFILLFYTMLVILFNIVPFWVLVFII